MSDRLAADVLDLIERTSSDAQSEVACAEVSAQRARETVAELETRLGPNDPAVANALIDLGYKLLSAGRIDEAESSHRRALAIDEFNFGDISLEVCRDLSALGQLLNDCDCVAQAESLLRRALSIPIQLNQSESAFAFPPVMTSLAAVLRKAGKYSEAERLNRDALELDEKDPDASETDIAEDALELSKTLLASGQTAEAVRLSRQGMELLEKRYGEKDWRLTFALRNFGRALIASNDFAAASSILQRALEIDLREFGRGSLSALKDIALLARLAYQNGDVVGTIKLYNQGAKFMEVGDVPLFAFSEFMEQSWHFLSEIGQLDFAHDLIRGVLTLEEESDLGCKRVLIARHMTLLAATLHRMDRDEEAASLHRRAESLFAEQSDSEIWLPELRKSLRDAFGSGTTV